MSDANRCIECSKLVPDTESGFILFGMLFACSTTCAEAYARGDGIAPGYRPGEPNYSCEPLP